MGVSVNKKRACPHLPLLHQTGMAVRPMARPAATRENTTVEPSCRRTDGARLPRADNPVTGKRTRPLKKGRSGACKPEYRQHGGKIAFGGHPPHGIANAKESHPFTGGRRSNDYLTA